MATLESLLFGSIPQGIRNPAGNDYSIIGKYFHDMHAQAHYTVGGDGRANDNFHPIAACTKAVIMGIACSIITNQICKVVPGSLRNHFRIGLEEVPGSMRLQLFTKQLRDGRRHLKEKQRHQDRLALTSR